MGKIIEIPFTENLIKFIGEQILEKQRYDYSSTAVVFAHRRPILYLRQMMTKQLNQPFFPPKMFSMDDFISSLTSQILPDFTLVNRLDSIYLLFQAVTKLNKNPWDKPGFSFAQFLPWGIKIERVIEEIDIEMVKDENLKGIQIEELWEPNVVRNAGLLMGHLAEIRKIYHTLLDEQGLITRGRNYALAAENIEELSLPFKTIYFGGLFAMSQAEKTIIRYLLKQPAVTFIRQNDEIQWTPFEEMNEWVEEIEHGTQSTQHRAEIFLHEAFNTHSEIVELRDIITEDRSEYEKTAIVLPDPEPLIPLLSEVMTTLETDYNITMGYPAVRTPIYALLDLFIKLQETRRDNTYYVDAYLSLLMHPYIKNIQHQLKSTQMRILIHSIEEILLNKGKMFNSLDEIEEEAEIFEQAQRLTAGEVTTADFKNTLIECHDIFIRRMDGIRTLASLADFFEGILIYLAKFSPAIHYPFSGEFFNSFFLFLDKIKISILKDEEFKDTNNLINLFRYIVREEQIAFQGEPLKGLQIMGLLETRALNFDKIFLLNANEGILPASEPFDSLLPLPLRTALKMPLHYHNEEIYRYHFHHLVSSSRQIHIFYLKTEKQLRSRFVEKLVWEEEKRKGQIGVLKASQVALNVSFPRRHRFEVAKNQEILDILYKINLSATDLESYLDCPVKFYFSKVLRLKEKEEIPDELEAERIGNILHQILERLYRPLCGIGILGEKEYVELERNLSGVVESVFLENFGEIRGEQYLLQEITVARLKKYIQSEKKHIGNCTIISTEENLSCSFSLADGISICLTGRADRIDHLGKEWMIIDYKSGNLKRFRLFDKILKSRDEMKKEIESLQLPFYALLYQRMHHILRSEINSKLVSLRLDEEKLLFDENVDREEFLEEIFLPTLRNLIAEILSPDIPFVVDGKEERCRFCPFPTFCRKG
ncbi:MAG: PD-(D/E)XK nuclease family protein [bacterium]